MSMVVSHAIARVSLGRGASNGMVANGGLNLLSRLSLRRWDTFAFCAALEPGSGVLGELEYDEGELAEVSEDCRGVR